MLWTLMLYAVASSAFAIGFLLSSVIGREL